MRSIAGPRKARGSRLVSAETSQNVADQASQRSAASSNRRFATYFREYLLGYDLALVTKYRPAA